MKAPWRVTVLGNVLMPVLCVAGLPAAAVCAGEAPAPECALPTHAGRDAYLPCVAFVKDSYLVAWQSGRVAPGDLREGVKFNGDIVGCRVGRNGQALSAEPFVICGAPDLQERPRAAAGKDVVLVVWHDRRAVDAALKAGTVLTPANNPGWDVYGARVSPDGKVLDPDGFLISGGLHNQAKPCVAWDGANFIVAWQDFRDGKKYDAYAARVTVDDKVLDPEGIRLSATKAGGSDPTVTSKGDGKTFAFWTGGSGALRPHAEGAFLSDGKLGTLFFKQEDPRAGPGGRHTPSFSCAGKDVFLLAWRNHFPAGRESGDRTVTACIFDAQGKPSPSFSISGGDLQTIGEDLCWDGTGFVVAWTQYADVDQRKIAPYEVVKVSRIAAEGKLAGTAQAVSGVQDAPAMNAAVASDGAGLTLVVYEKHPEKAEAPIRIGCRVLVSGNQEGRAR